MKSIVIDKTYFIPKYARTLHFNYGDKKAVPLTHWKTEDLKVFLSRFYGKTKSPIRKEILVGASRQEWIEAIKFEISRRG